MLLKHIFCLLLLFVFNGLFGQDRSSKPAFHFLVLDESFALPGLAFVSYPYNPAFQLGAELPLKQGLRHDWFVSANAGFYFHRYIRTAGFLNGRIGYRRRFGRFNIGLNVGPGAALAYATQAVYAFEDGDYRETSNSGQLVFMPGATLGLGYRLGPRPGSPELLLHYEFAIDQPFSVLPVPHLFAGLGLRIFPFTE